MTSLNIFFNFLVRSPTFPLPPTLINFYNWFKLQPYFFLNDLNNNKNVWGPGIILARRVMDLGDSGHILITETLAENLMALDNWYKKIIKFAGYHEIKHGQKIKVYLVTSENFGNSAIPKNFV